MNTLQQQETQAILAMAERIKELEAQLEKAREEIRALNQLLMSK